MLMMHAPPTGDPTPVSKHPTNGIAAAIMTAGLSLPGLNTAAGPNDSDENMMNAGIPDLSGLDVQEQVLSSSWL